MRFKTELLGNHVTLRKGLSYKGDYLVEESSLGLVGLDAFVAGGGYKPGAEKPYSGPFKPDHLAESGDVLLAMTEQQDGLLASPLIVPENLGGYEELVLSHHVAKVVAKSGQLRPEFVFNFLRIPINRTRAAYGNTGTTVQDLPYDVIYEQLIPIPSLHEQDRINSFVATLDRKIELNYAMATTLEQIAQTMFKSWFIDFDPVKAKMAGEKPRGMDNTTSALFPDSMMDSEIGQIPSGWSIKTLDTIATHRKESVGIKDLSADEVYVDLDSIPRKSLYFNDWKSAAQVQSGKTRFCSNDILFGKLRPYFHKVVIAPVSGVCSTDIVVVNAKSKEFLPYVSCLVNQTSFIDFLSHRSTGTQMPRTSWSEMCEFRFACPPDLVLKNFGQFMLSSIEEALKYQLQARKIIELRAELLPRLISKMWCRFENTK
jgi:type I restriction enzyme S subunit